jgi:uncharacterized Fe-S cluster-containing radical SAM superfamily protein
MVYDPVLRHKAIEKLVTRRGSQGCEKKYYRFRLARWYGGIVTADCAGCGLLCRFCWVRDSVMLHPASIGHFYTATEVAERLVTIARTHHLDQLRLSGGEPTLGKPHLLELLDLLGGKGLSFILETNGIPIAYEEDYAKELSKHDFVHIRVSLKGCNEGEFSLLTGSKPEGFRLQLQSLEKLCEEGANCHAAIMTSFSKPRNHQTLLQDLRRISPDLCENAETEELILYPHVTKRLQRWKLKYISAYEPSRVPPERI